MAPLDNSDTLEPDTSVVDGDDSVLGSDIKSIGSASITSSIVGYKYENGRRYHAYREGSYYLPNDDAEQARLDMLHHVFCLALDGALYLAPLNKNIKRCMDFGTGTGIWAIDFADEFPDAEVIGTDLSPIQPNSVPPNLRFYVDDVESDWGYRSDEAFDFIHGRAMGGAIQDWNLLFHRIYDNLKPGGWVEMQEYEAWLFSKSDPTLSRCPNVKKWIELVNESSSKFGKEVDMAPKQKKLIEDAGFVDVQEKILPIPVGPWAKSKKAKELGTFLRENMLECVDTFTMSLFTRVLGWTVEECQVLMAHCRNEFRDPKNQLYGNYYFVYGRKPNH